MLKYFLGRFNRRYIALFFFLSASFLLWRNFGERNLRTRPGEIRYVPSSYDWSKAKVFHPVKDMRSPPSGPPRALPRVQLRAKSAAEDAVAKKRKKAIKHAFSKSWNAYKKYAWKMDELKPLTATGHTSFSGWGAQLVDALDGLWILGLKDDFYEAVREVAVIDWSNTNDKRINLFEVTIRYLGGLLAAYDLSQEPVLLKKAIELGDALYATFDTPNRLPSHWLNYDTAKAGRQEADESMSLAAGGTLCLEFTRLSQLTDDPKYYDATERLKQFFRKFQNETKIPGLWTHDVNYRKEQLIDSRFSLGSGADSMYEYLPKMVALLGGLDPEYEQMAIQSLEAARDELLFRPMLPNGDDVLFPGSAIVMRGEKDMAHEMEHLACFVGGMYGLAGKLLSRGEFVQLGERLTAGCVWLYDATPTNIMPEVELLVPCPSNKEACPYEEHHFLQAKASNLPPGLARVRDARYMLRPEAIESVYYMWRITGDQKWRDAAWRMWEGIVREAETDIAFATVKNVLARGKVQDDAMETFWLGETIKYLYLIFEDESVINLDEWVFNTEAHAFRRPQR